MSSAWILTSSGRMVDLIDPQPDMIHLGDIVHSLTKLCRFSGHCSRFYSVAEHCWLGSQQFTDRHLQVEFQLHDATEAYLGDVVSPLKNILQEYKLIEARMDRVIRERFCLPLTMSPGVAAMDLRMLATERRDLLPADGGEWEPLRGVEPIGFIPPTPFPPGEIEWRLARSISFWMSGHG